MGFRCETELSPALDVATVIPDEACTAHDTAADLDDRPHRVGLAIPDYR